MVGITTVLKKIDEINRRLDEHDRRFDGHDKRFDEHDGRFDRLDDQLHRFGLRLEEQIDLSKQILEAVQTLSDNRPTITEVNSRFENHEHRISAIEYSLKPTK